MKFNRQIIYFLVAVSVIFLSYKYYHLKWLGYESIPGTTNILDERNYAFAGYTFRKTGVPTAWTNMDIYKDLADTKKHTNIAFNGLHITSNSQNPSLKNISDFNYPVYSVTDIDIGKGEDTIRLVQPFFDHPILGSYLYSLRISNNPQNYSQLQPADYRYVSLIASVISGVLIFIAAFLIFKNLATSFFSLAIYSTVPIYILSSRYALFENLLIPLYLGAVILLTLYSSKKSNFLLLLIGLISGLAFNIKETGIFVLIFSTIFLFSERISFKKLLFVFFPFLILTLIYYGYAFYLSPQLMSQLLFSQANRGFYGSLNFISSINNLAFHNFPIEGYWLWGFISLVMLDIKNRSHSILHLGAITYILVFIFFGGSNYPWYYLPLVPSFVLASAYQLKQLFVSPTYTRAFLFFFFPFCTSFYWGYSVFHSSSNLINIFRIILLTFFSISFGYIYLKKSNYPLKFINPALLKPLWYLVLIIIIFQVNKWNWQSFLYITANWSQLPNSFYIK